MGTILASSILGKAAIILSDVAGVQYTAAENLGWLNDAQVLLVEQRPDCNTVLNSAVALVNGTKQTLPVAAYQLLDVIRSTGAGGAVNGPACTRVARKTMDMALPNWHNAQPQNFTRHYIFDMRAPTNFLVYPPAIAGNCVEALYSAVPDPITSAANPINVDDIYGPVLLDLLLYRAFSKDHAVPGTAERAKMHWDAALAVLGQKAQADVGVESATQQQSGG